MALSPFQEAHTSHLVPFPCVPGGQGVWVQEQWLFCVHQPEQDRRDHSSTEQIPQPAQDQVSPHQEGGSAWSFQNGKSHIPGVPSCQCGIEEGGCAGMGGHRDTGEVVPVPWVTPWRVFAVGKLHPGFPSLVAAFSSLSQLSLSHPQLSLPYPPTCPPVSLFSPFHPCFLTLLSLPDPIFLSHILIFTPSSQLPPPYFPLSFVS